MKTFGSLLFVWLFGVCFLMTGEAHAYAQTNVGISFWRTDTFESDLDEYAIAALDSTIPSGYDLQYNIGNGRVSINPDSYIAGDSLMIAEESFTVADEVLIQFQIVDSDDAISMSSLDFSLETTPGLHKGVTISWMDGSSIVLGLSGADIDNVDTVWLTSIPPSALLLGSGVVGLIGFGLRRRRNPLS